MDPTDIPPSHDPDEPRDETPEQPPAQPFEPGAPDDAGATPAAYSYGTESAEAVLGLEPVKRRSKVVVLALAIAVALIAAGTFVAVRSGTTVTALDTMVPSDAIAFVSAQVRPSGSQQDGLRSLLGRLPESRRNQLTDGFRQQLETAFKEADLDYETEVEPWLGNTAAVAVRPPAEGSTRGPIVVGLLEVKDESKARTAFGRVQATDDDVVYLVQNGVAYIADEMVDITSFRAAVEARGSLSSNAAYAKEAALVGDALAMAWFDAGALQQQLGGLLGPGMGSPFGNTQLGQTVSGTGAIGLRVSEDGIELYGHGAIVGGGPVPVVGALKLLEGAPNSAVASLSIFNPAAILESVQQFMSLFTGGFETTAVLQPVQENPLDLFGGADPLEQLGLDLEKDVLPWLRGELSVVVGGVTSSPLPDIAVLIQPTDDAAATRTLDKIEANLGRLDLSVQSTSDGFTVNTGFVTLSVVRAGDRIVVASSPAYARTVSRASAESLGRDAIYQRTFGSNAEHTAAQLYVRIDRLQSLLEVFLPADERATYEKDVKPFLDELQSLGFRVTADGSEGTFSLKLLVRS